MFWQKEGRQKCLHLLPAIFLSCLRAILSAACCASGSVHSRLLVDRNLFTPLAHADSDSFAARAERAYTDAQQLVRKERPTAPRRPTRARRLRLGEFARKDTSRADIAQQGIDAARAVISRVPTNAAAHYWLGMNLGQLARTKTLGALKLVREMEAEFARAGGLDPHTDYAGPDRSLGLLYRDAPGWPTSIGSKKRAREYLERAVLLHPEFPANPVALLESFEQWADRQSFDRQLKTTERALTEAKSKFTGAEWEESWADWNKRLAEMRARAARWQNTPEQGREVGPLHSHERLRCSARLSTCSLLLVLLPGRLVRLNDEGAGGAGPVAARAPKPAAKISLLASSFSLRSMASCAFLTFR